MATNSSSKPSTASVAIIQVKAAPGVRVPMQGAARKYITDAEAVSVPRTAYYVRRLQDRDLVLADAPAGDVAAKVATPASTGTRAPGVVSEA